MADDQRTERVPRQGPGAAPDWLYWALSATFALGLVAALSFLAYAVLVPAPGAKFTEFYLLGPAGSAGDYPLKFRLGEAKPLTVGIASHEQRAVAYDLAVTLGDGVNASTLHSESVTLEDGERWERSIEVRPGLAGADLKLEFLLYADGNRTAPYRDLRLWIDVTPPLY